MKPTDTVTLYVTADTTQGSYPATDDNMRLDVAHPAGTKLQFLFQPVENFDTGAPVEQILLGELIEKPKGGRKLEYLGTITTRLSMPYATLDALVEQYKQSLHTFATNVNTRFDAIPDPLFRASGRWKDFRKLTQSFLDGEDHMGMGELLETGRRIKQCSGEMLGPDTLWDIIFRNLGGAR